jgi:hypothetical protein
LRRWAFVGFVVATGRVVGWVRGGRGFGSMGRVQLTDAPINKHNHPTPNETVDFKSFLLWILDDNLSTNQPSWMVDW